MSTFIGIDPGKSGAMACIYPNGEGQVVDLPYLVDVPDVRAIMAWLECDTVIYPGEVRPLIVIERQQSMPKQGVASTFQTGMGYGALQAMCYLSNCAWWIERPSVWKQKMGLAGKTKEDSRALAIQLFPALAGELKRVKDEGRAEALLLAYYGKKFLA